MKTHHWVVLFWLALFLGGHQCIHQTGAAEREPWKEKEIRNAVERGLPLLERASAGSADQRQCFTCHTQALPVFALSLASHHGFHPDPTNYKRQIDHTYAHLERGKSVYKEGKGQGGGVDTAGYALWTLEDGNRQPDETTDIVVDWLLKKQNDDGYWKHTSNRPPSEASSFTTTHLALRAISGFGRVADRDRIETAKSKAANWLKQARAVDTEDKVFRLLSTGYVDLPSELVAAIIRDLQEGQRDDGGWAQLPSMPSDAYATGSALFALHRTGMGIDDPIWQRGIAYLLSTQLADGSWHVVSRSKPFQTYYESGFPHGTDQFISTAATGWALSALLLSLPTSEPPKIDILANTLPIEWPESDLSGRLMFGAHQFVEGEIARANAARKVNDAGPHNYDTLRHRLREVLGVVDTRLPPRMERYGDDDRPAVVMENDQLAIYQVRWPVFDQVNGEGLLVQQKGTPAGACIVVPDADQTPEQLLGLAEGLDRKQQIARILAEQGFDLVIPTIVPRQKMQTDDPRLQKADMTYREWIYRQAFHMGRHIIGYEVQRVLAAIDYLQVAKGHRGTNSIVTGIVGYGEGGLIAMHAAALDERIEVAWVSGYFDSSHSCWDEPIYRSVWNRLGSLGNAEVASLIQPRGLIIEYSPFPEVKGHKGALRTPELGRVQLEFDSIRKDNPGKTPVLVAGEKNATIGPWSDQALKPFSEFFGATISDASSASAWVDRRKNPEKEVADRQRRCVDQLENHVQMLVRGSEHVRDRAYLHKVMPDFAQRRWSTERHHTTTNPDSFIAASKEYRQRLAQEGMGRFARELDAPRARTRRVAETDKWVAYDVVLDVHDQLFAWGVLVLPKDLKADERRPVVVCQHGRQGIPRDTIDANNSAYNNFAAELAERGFITFAPHNLYRGEDEYRWLNRKANAIGCTLFSFILSSHEQILRWLDRLPFVDGDRIAFYGLSYGGETAVRVPTILDKYCLSICSGDFNQWTRKVAATDQPFSFMYTIEWEMPYWNLGQTFDYAEMAYLMLPRPFMVERGHNDGVGRDQWVAHEFAKVRWLYAQFGLEDRIGIEYFQGGHSIHGVGTFDFLHRHLHWPRP